MSRGITLNGGPGGLEGRVSNWKTSIFGGPADCTLGWAENVGPPFSAALRSALLCSPSACPFLQPAENSCFSVENTALRSVLSCHEWPAASTFACLRRKPRGWFYSECCIGGKSVAVRCVKYLQWQYLFLLPITAEHEAGQATNSQIPFSSLRCVPTENRTHTTRVSGACSTHWTTWPDFSIEKVKMKKINFVI